VGTRSRSPSRPRPRARHLDRPDPEDKIYETLWDLLKLAGGLCRTRADHAYLVVGAPAVPWGGGGVGADLIADGACQTRELFERYRRACEWLLKETKARPNHLPAAVETRLLAAVRMHLADAPYWELRVVSVSVLGETWVPCEDGWPVPHGARLTTPG
jgi:hypothetical protein